jgi:enoyl-[acyl-carrier-protein] reductase (NADH)
MVDASEVAFVAVFLASDKAWAVSGELVVAKRRGRAVGILLSRPRRPKIGC